MNFTQYNGIIPKFIISIQYINYAILSTIRSFLIIYFYRFILYHFRFFDDVTNST